MVLSMRLTVLVGVFVYCGLLQADETSPETGLISKIDFTHLNKSETAFAKSFVNAVLALNIHRRNELVLPESRKCTILHPEYEEEKQLAVLEKQRALLTESAKGKTYNQRLEFPSLETHNWSYGFLNQVAGDKIYWPEKPTHIFVFGYKMKTQERFLVLKGGNYYEVLPCPNK